MLQQTPIPNEPPGRDRWVPPGAFRADPVLPSETGPGVSGAAGVSQAVGTAPGGVLPPLRRPLPTLSPVSRSLSLAVSPGFGEHIWRHPKPLLL